MVREAHPYVTLQVHGAKLRCDVMSHRYKTPPTPTGVRTGVRFGQDPLIYSGSLAVEAA
jgi:hypothetical protein